MKISPDFFYGYDRLKAKLLKVNGVGLVMLSSDQTLLHVMRTKNNNRRVRIIESVPCETLMIDNTKFARITDVNSLLRVSRKLSPDQKDETFLIGEEDSDEEE